MEAAKLLAIQVMKNFGFDVTSIPHTKVPTADLRVQDGTSLILIEVKEKFESAELAEGRQSKLKQGETYQQEDKLARDNRISGILTEAQKQLDATQSEIERFQVIWFQPNGIDADAKYRQAFATFYGYVHLVARHPPQPETKECLYFDYSSAFQMPTIEALILTDGKGLQVCLNEFSNRAVEFRATKFFQEFESRNAVFDPLALEAAGKIIACRATIPRTNDTDTAKALQLQTGVLYMPIRLTRYSSSLAIDFANRVEGAPPPNKQS